jgi:hypothetical protein
MKTKRVRKGAAQRYLNALWHLYSNTETIESISAFCSYHQISKTAGATLKECGYIKKVGGKYVYFKHDAPTIHDAKFILKQLKSRNAIVLQSNKSKDAIKPLPTPAPVQSTVIPNIWFYMAVIAMCTTLVTIALVLLK